MGNGSDADAKPPAPLGLPGLLTGRMAYLRPRNAEPESEGGLVTSAGGPSGGLSAGEGWVPRVRISTGKEKDTISSPQVPRAGEAVRVSFTCSLRAARGTPHRRDPARRASVSLRLPGDPGAALAPRGGRRASEPRAPCSGETLASPPRPGDTGPATRWQHDPARRPARPALPSSAGHSAWDGGSRASSGLTGSARVPVAPSLARSPLSARGPAP